MNIRLLSTVALVSLVGCIKPLDVKVEDVPKLATLEEVMRANETTGGPLWKRAGSDAYEDAEWAQFKDDAAKMIALAERTKSFSRGPVYDKHAAAIEAQAKDLAAAAEAKDVAKTNQAVDAMKASCKACHADTR